MLATSGNPRSGQARACDRDTQQWAPTTLPLRGSASQRSSLCRCRLDAWCSRRWCIAQGRGRAALRHVGAIHRSLMGASVDRLDPVQCLQATGSVSCAPCGHQSPPAGLIHQQLALLALLPPRLGPLVHNLQFEARSEPAAAAVAGRGKSQACPSGPNSSTRACTRRRERCQWSCRQRR